MMQIQERSWAFGRFNWVVGEVRFGFKEIGYQRNRLYYLCKQLVADGEYEHALLNYLAICYMDLNIPYTYERMDLLNVGEDFVWLCPDVLKEIHILAEGLGHGQATVLHSR